eukprot:3170806-Pleurochrysis_carterae.AAC.1
MASSETCNAQYTLAFNVAQIARPTLPEAKAVQATDSVSDAASEKAEEGEARARGCAAEGPVSSHLTSDAKGMANSRQP